MKNKDLLFHILVSNGYLIIKDSKDKLLLKSGDNYYTATYSVKDDLIIFKKFKPISHVQILDSLSPKDLAKAYISAHKFEQFADFIYSLCDKYCILPFIVTNNRKYDFIEDDVIIPYGLHNRISALNDKIANDSMFHSIVSLAESCDDPDLILEEYEDIALADYRILPHSKVLADAIAQSFINMRDYLNHYNINDYNDLTVYIQESKSNIPYKDSHYIEILRNILREIADSSDDFIHSTIRQLAWDLFQKFPQGKAETQSWIAQVEYFVSPYIHYLLAVRPDLDEVDLMQQLNKLCDIIVCNYCDDEDIMRKFMHIINYAKSCGFDTGTISDTIRRVYAVFHS